MLLSYTISKFVISVLRFAQDKLREKSYQEYGLKR